MSVVTKFLSNKYNLWGLIMLCSILIGYILGQYLSAGELWIVFLLLAVNNFCIMTYGMAQGMIMMGHMRDEFVKAMKKLRNYPTDDTE